MTDPNHPTLTDIANHHLGECEAWKHSATVAEHAVQKKICTDKAEWHLRAAAEILTHAPKKDGI